MRAHTHIHTHTHRVNSHPAGPLPRCLQWLRLGQAKARSLAGSAGHHRLPPMVCICRKLELEVELLGLEPSHSDLRCGIPTGTLTAVPSSHPINNTYLGDDGSISKLERCRFQLCHTMGYVNHDLPLVRTGHQRGAHSRSSAVMILEW